MSAARHRWLQVLLSLLLCLVARSSCVAAAPVDTDKPVPLVVNTPGEPLVDLGGPWQFRMGDDPRWAAPGYDDAAWRTILTTEGWDLQGYPDTGGFAWYRRHIHLEGTAAAGQPLALAAAPMLGAYEVFWNGVRVGGCGSLPPHFRSVNCWIPTTLPRGAKPGDAVVAFRVFCTGIYHLEAPGSEGLINIPQLGTEDAADADAEQSLYEQQNAGAIANWVALLYAVAALLTGITWLLERGERLYVWLTLFLVSKALRGALHYGFNFGDMSTQWYTLWLFTVGYGCAFAALWMLLLRLFRLDASRFWKRLTLWMVAACLLVNTAAGVMNFHIGSWTTTTALAFKWIYVAQTALALYSLALIAAGLRRRADTARWCVAATATVGVMVPVTGNALALLQHWSAANRIAYTPLAHFWGGTITLITVSNFALLLAFCYAAVRTLLDSRRHRMETELELRSAAEVQQVLLPEKTAVIPGFAIETSYRPAGEVGGDFFQVVPLSDGGVLIVLGDVSGKGMPAAMTVALLVGAVRTLAEYTRSPAAMLTGMNQRMLGRGNGGFTTCLAAHIGPDGEAVLASAGHLQPYVDGRELALEPGLPLGLVDGAVYGEASLRLAPGDRLVLLTDGVVEARNTKGELFGFDRTARIASQSAEAIAQAGAAFGQTDDITVLTLTYRPAATLGATG